MANQIIRTGDYQTLSLAIELSQPKVFVITNHSEAAVLEVAHRVNGTVMTIDRVRPRNSIFCMTNRELVARTDSGDSTVSIAVAQSLPAKVSGNASEED